MIPANPPLSPAHQECYPCFFGPNPLGKCTERDVLLSIGFPVPSVYLSDRSEEDLVDIAGRLLNSSYQVLATNAQDTLGTM